MPQIMPMFWLPLFISLWMFLQKFMILIYFTPTKLPPLIINPVKFHNPFILWY